MFSQICIVTLMSAQFSLGSRSLFFARYGFRSQQSPSDGPFFLSKRALLSDEMVPSIVAEDGIALRVYCRLAEGQASLFRNPKNTFEQQPRSTVFW